MKLKLYRYKDTGKETLGILMVNDVFCCYTLEDTYQKHKIPGQTRIPEDIYDLGFHQSPKFGSTARTLVSDYRGLPLLENVDGFSYILIHWGNNATHTEGCILVGKGVRSRSLVSSRDAWVDLYGRIIDAKDRGENIKIEILDLES